METPLGRSTEYSPSIGESLVTSRLQATTQEEFADILSKLFFLHMYEYNTEIINSILLTFESISRILVSLSLLAVLI